MHTRRTIIISASLLLSLLLPSVAGAKGKSPTHASVPVYLALGDSLGAGVGASKPAKTGYVPLFHDYLRGNYDCERGRSGCSPLQLRNISVSGATTTSLVADQLPLAVAELQARNGDSDPRNDVEVITIDIGGNDAFALLGPCQNGITAQCVGAIQTTFGTIAQNLTLTLSQLRSAAGPDTEIIVMTYYNPLPSCQLSAFSALGNVVLEGGGPLPAGLNDLIRQIAAPFGASVAETFGLLGPADLVGGTDCLHADDSGYRLIAGAFADALP